MTLDMISNRHRGNLGGRLTDNHLPAKVSVLLDADTARHATAQHLTWMLLTEPQISDRIHLLESMADYRWEIVSGGIEEQHDTRYDF